MLVPVPADQVGEWWDIVRPHIKRVVDRGGRYTPESIHRALLAREMQLWLAVEDGEVICACVTEIITYPLMKVCTVFLAAGRDHKKWAHYMLDLERWAKANGCVRMDTLARPGFLRVLKPIIKNLRVPNYHLEWDIA